MTKKYHHGDLRDALIKAGLEILETEGLDTLSLRKVAREAGVSHAAPYHHFANMTALIAAVAASGFEALDREVERRTKDETDPGRRLQTAAVTYVDFAVAHPDLFRLMFSADVADKTAHPELKVAAEKAFRHITGPTGGGPAGIASWSLVHGLAMLMLDNQVNVETAPSDVTLSVTEVLWEGLRKRMDPRA